MTEVSIDGGLRMCLTPPADRGQSLDVGLAVRRRPEPEDEIVTGHGSKVFVEPRLFGALADKTLDVAEPSGDDRVSFRVVS